jgi:hypothetical protein
MTSGIRRGSTFRSHENSFVGESHFHLFSRLFCTTRQRKHLFFSLFSFPFPTALLTNSYLRNMTDVQDPFFVVKEYASPSSFFCCITHTHAHMHTCTHAHVWLSFKLSSVFIIPQGCSGEPGQSGTAYGEDSQTCTRR